MRAASMQIVPLPQNGSRRVGACGLIESAGSLSMKFLRFLYQSLLYNNVAAMNSPRTACV